MNFLRGNFDKITDPESCALEPSLQLAKYQLQLGLFTKAEQSLETLLADPAISDSTLSQAQFTLGKVYFVMNRYEEALSLYEKVHKRQGGDRVLVKYRQKALANMALVKCQSLNTKQALALCEGVELGCLDFVDQIKHKIKTATVLKRSLCYLDALALLSDAESGVTKELVDDTCAKPHKLMKLLHKIMRDKARLNFWLKNEAQDRHFEEQA